jgi:hypothetical protein
LHHPAQAQADTTRARRDTARVARDTTVRVPARPPADSMLRDTLAKRDSARAQPVRRDTLKAPFARAPMPQPIEIGQTLVYDRAALFATGALTLQDLLDRIPGNIGLRSGWIASPMVSAYLGDVRRVRVFFDGLEYDELDPRAGGVLDLTQLQLWTLEELRIERGASEIRVYTRSWRVDRTTPYTRTDIGTGDQQTNLYRGYFGRRYGGGAGFQLGAQQYGTTPQLRSSPSSDQLALLGRIGWARAGWSFDAFALRTNRNRGTVRPQQLRDVPAPDSITGVESTRLDAYVRGAYGDPERGLWLQALAGGLGYTIKHVDNSTGTAADTARDTTRFRAQYLVAGGFTWAGLRLNVAGRLRVGDAHRLATPSAGAAFVSGPLALSLFAEGRGPDSLSRAEVVARLTPLPFISFLGAAGRTADHRSSDSPLTSDYLRAEAGIRLLRLWLIGGFIRRDSVLLVPPRVFGSSFDLPVQAPSATGISAAVRGTLYGPLKLNLSGVRWNDSSALYQPRYQSRSEVYISTNWLSHFPTGNFGIVASATHEYRSSTKFPVSLTTGDAIISVPDSRTYNFLLEIRIVSAVLSYQFRNIRGDLYQLVPGYLMPRQTQFYGVRWEFWN